MNKAVISRVAPLVLPEEQPLRRESPRRPEDRNADFDTLYDGSTLFYDCIFSDSQISLVGPPFENLAEKLEAARYSIGGTNMVATFAESPKVQRVVADLPAKSGQLRLTLKIGELELSVLPSQAQHELFSGLNVIQTMNKDNDLDWIRDWATFYVKAHGANAVLFYENASSGYDIEQLAATLESVAGLRQIVIVDWPFKYGPQGYAASGPSVWDSDYSQVASFEHARRRFLGSARAWLNCDIDELVLLSNGKSVFDAAIESNSIGVCYPGKWISPIAAAEDAPSIYQEFPYLMPGAPSCPNKWCVVPKRLNDNTWMTVHSSRGQQLELLEGAGYRHYRGVSNGWKYQRTRSTSDSAELEVDKEISHALERVYSKDPVPKRQEGSWLRKMLRNRTDE